MYTPARTRGVPAPLADLLLVVRVPAAQPALQLSKRRRHHEYADRVRPVLGDLVHALHVNVQQDMHALGAAPLNIALRRAVAVANVFGVLQQLVPRDHGVKRRARDEKIVLAVHLAGTRSARRGRNGEAHVIPQAHQPGDDRALSGAGRPGDQNQFSCLAVHVASPPVS